MSKSVFQFKQFSISHEKSAMKVGTDGVLLGAWVNTNKAERILDIGSGTGLIGLMLAQRTTTSKIDCVEIDIPSYTEMVDNIAKSPWKNRIKAYAGDIQSFEQQEPYDLIVSNPPYFLAGTNSPLKNRHQARHADSLSFEELVSSYERLLKPGGKGAVILPMEEGMHFLSLIRQYSFYPTRQTNYFSKKGRSPERMLLEFGRDPSPVEVSELIHYNQDNQWTEDYIQLTKDFYLKL